MIHTHPFFFAVILASLISYKGLAQETIDSPPTYFSISAGAGICSFFGDIGKADQVNSLSYTRTGYSLLLEGVFAKNQLGIGLNILSGKMAKGERSVLPSRNNNFQTIFNQAGLSISFYLQNKKGKPVIPYITSGLSYAILDTKTDIKYHGDSLYYYWTDGSIRNLPQDDINSIHAKKVVRDYMYESPLPGADASVISIPIGIGFKLRAGEKINFNIGTTYYLSMSDKIDALAGGENDRYLHSYFSIGYNFNRKKVDGKAKPLVDYSSLDKTDADSDGVIDIDDRCPSTPKGVKVDVNGCPFDRDEDGVPDFMDKEPNSQRGLVVNTEGKIITKEMIAIERAKLDSLRKMEENTLNSQSSSQKNTQASSPVKQTATSKTSGKSSKIPLEFRGADTNKDDIISAQEVIAVIDGFFDEKNNYTVQKVYALIDYFFEQ